jgi:hypothetical protein
VTALACAGAGFLAAVLWFDLIFDVQVRGHRGRELPEEVLDSIAAYYRRAAAEAVPMNRLVALAMLATLAAIVAEIAGDEVPAATAWASLALALPAIGLALVRSYPAAVRLGTLPAGSPERSALARSLLRDHLFCLAAIAAVLALQLAAAL